MRSLPELVRSFGQTLNDLERETPPLVTTTMGGRSHLVGMQLAESAADVITAGRALARAHRRAIGPYRATLASGPVAARAGTLDLKTQAPELDELRLLMKSWWFFVRAFCDNAYQLLLGEIENRAARAGGSMNAALHPGNPVGTELNSVAPEVLPWFEELRQVRNDMKRGAAFGFTQLDARGLGLTVYILRAHVSPVRRVSIEAGRTLILGDAAGDALRVRTDVLRLIATSQAAPQAGAADAA
jgi:hypothetical protein